MNESRRSMISKPVPWRSFWTSGVDSMPARLGGAGFVPGLPVDHRALVVEDDHSVSGLERAPYVGEHRPVFLQMVVEVRDQNGI